MSENTLNFWQQLPSRSWPDLLTEKWGAFSSPITARLPIQPSHSSDLIHVGPALEVSRRRVVPKLNANDLAALRSVAQNENLLVQFVLGNPPAVPDFRRSKLSLEDGIYPIVKAEYYVFEGPLYCFDYFCVPTPDSTVSAPQSILWVRCSVTNQKLQAQICRVCVKVQFSREDEVFDYHYAPYFWDASKFLPSPEVRLSGNQIAREGNVSGKSKPVISPSIGKRKPILPMPIMTWLTFNFIRRTPRFVTALLAMLFTCIKNCTAAKRVLSSPPLLEVIPKYRSHLINT